MLHQSRTAAIVRRRRHLRQHLSIAAENIPQLPHGRLRRNIRRHIDRILPGPRNIIMRECIRYGRQDHHRPRGCQPAAHLGLAQPHPDLRMLHLAIQLRPVEPAGNHIAILPADRIHQPGSRIHREPPRILRHRDFLRSPDRQCQPSRRPTNQHQKQNDPQYKRNLSHTRYLPAKQLPK